MYAWTSPASKMKVGIYFIVLLLSISLVGAVCTVNEAEPNDDFSQATPFSMDDCGNEANLKNVFYDDHDRDIFSISSPIKKGQTVSISGAASLVAFFDQNDNLLYREYVSSSISRSFVAHENLPKTSILFVPNGLTDLSSKVSLESGTLSSHGLQKVLLDFDGGENVQIHTRPPISFPAFEYSEVAALYPGQEQELKQKIIQVVRESYSDFPIEIYTTDDAQMPAEPYATVYFGGGDVRLLGIADSVDQYNSDLFDNAIIYVDEFDDFSVMDLSVEEMANMIGNTGAHELGHLLGLFHTNEVDEIMDTYGTAWDLTQPKTFHQASLDKTVAPIGFQDSIQKLGFITNMDSTGSCIDSDHGWKIFTRGEVSYGPRPDGSYSHVLTDNCVGNTLNEYICNGDIATTTYHQCLVGCSEGKCNDLPKCYDPDGVDYTKKSTSYYRPILDTDGYSGILQDYCAGNKVREYFCTVEGSLTDILHDCGDMGSCVDGRCVQGSPVCYDSDGSNYNNMGKITFGASGGTQYTEWDYCDGFELNEKVCNTQHLPDNEEHICELGCVDGACIQPASCVDSDKGLDYNFKGTVQYNLNPDGTYTDSLTDVCSGGGSSTLNEYTCVNGAPKNNPYVCPNGCADGKCNPISSAPPALQQVQCKDSDNGLNYFMQGIVQFNPNANGQYQNSLTDVCSGGGSSTLNEYSCENNAPKTNYHICLNGCSNGKCNALPQCLDSDGGLSYFTAGVTSVGPRGDDTYASSFSDSCSTANNVIEYRCNGNLQEAKGFLCLNGCSNGKCNPVSACVDSDNGLSYNVFGVVQFNPNANGQYQGSLNDSCSQGTLTEYTCQNNLPKENSYACPYGCANGRCVEKTCSDSEEGVDFYFKGSVAYTSAPNGYYTKSDVCVNELNPATGFTVPKLYDYYCNSQGGLQFTEHICLNGCGDGVCNYPLQCYDSDGGIKEFVTGVVSYNPASNDVYSYNLVDSCSGDTLNEYSCANAAPKTNYITCLNGCSDGKCNPQTPCYDTDGGLNYAIYGKVYWGLSDGVYALENEDYCIGNTLREYKCDGTVAHGYSYSCPNGCSNGKCN